MGTLIDASVLIDAERGEFDLDALFARLPDEDFAIAAITASELIHGVLRAGSSKQRQLRAEFVEGVLNGYRVVPFDLSVARVHAKIWTDLIRRGSMIGERDIMIAATAIAFGFDVATRDQRSFPRIRGLKLTRL